jgi:hypothetical protein
MTLPGAALLGSSADLVFAGNRNATLPESNLSPTLRASWRE